MSPLFCLSLCALEFSVGILNTQEPLHFQFDISQQGVPSTTHKAYFPSECFFFLEINYETKVV